MDSFDSVELGPFSLDLHFQKKNFDTRKNSKHHIKLPSLELKLFHGVVLTHFGLSKTVDFYQINLKFLIKWREFCVLSFRKFCVPWNFSKTICSDTLTEKVVLTVA